MQEILNNWKEMYPKGKILKYGKNALDDSLVAVYSNNSIYLLGKSYPTIMYAPKILLSRPDKHHIHVEDILMKHNNIGNGTFAMLALFEYAKAEGVTLITGDLSPVDNDHKQRRDHYYKKLGFDVTETYVSITIGGEI